MAAIGAASEALVGVTASNKYSVSAQDLASEIQQGSQRLNRVVGNLLDMTRLEMASLSQR